MVGPAGQMARAAEPPVSTVGALALARAVLGLDGFAQRIHDVDDVVRLRVVEGRWLDSRTAAWKPGPLNDRSRPV